MLCTCTTCGIKARFRWGWSKGRKRRCLSRLVWIVFLSITFSLKDTRVSSDIFAYIITPVGRSCPFNLMTAFWGMGYTGMTVISQQSHGPFYILRKVVVQYVHLWWI